MVSSRAAGFDESFVNGFEDVDLCLRAREQGRAIAYVANSRFVHYEAASAGRFDREAENERRFYRRWSASLASSPRTARGDVGAIAVKARTDGDPLLDAAREDLEHALRSFGHPVVHGEIFPWQRFDRRFRQAGTLAWFASESAPPGIAIARDGDSLATIRTHGAVALEVPWLPCASAQRGESLPIRRSGEPSCGAVGVAGGDDVRAAELAVELAACGNPTIRITAPMLLGDGEAELACIVHLGVTDESGFGNVVLAQAGLPAVVLATTQLRALFAPDVALIEPRNAIAGSVAALVADPAMRARYGRLVAADSQRRFSPRRSAIRVVDLLCAARFGLERPYSGEP